MRSFLAALSFLVQPCACDGSTPPAGPIESSTFAIGSIAVAVTVTSNGAAVLLDARVTTSGAMPLHLGGSDVLSAGASDAPDHAFGEYASGKYALLLTTQAQTIDLSFSRVGKVVSKTSLALPTPFAITAPSPAVRSKGLAFGWAPGAMGETLTLAVSGPCIAGMKLARAPDPQGSGFTLQAADFSTTTGACTLDVDVTRSFPKPTPLVNLAPGGGATLVQSRHVEIDTQP